jgi:hypothetical protein
MAVRAGFDARKAVFRLTRHAFPPDPGGIRMQDAARATLAGLATFIVTLLIGFIVPMPSGVEIFGFAASVFVMVSVRDETIASQRLTTVLAFLPMACLTVLTSLLVARPLALDALLVLLIAAAVYASAFGPRWSALAVVAVTSHLFGVVTQPPLSEVAERLAVLVLAVACAYLVRFVFWMVEPAEVAHRIAAGVAEEAVAMLLPVAEAVRIGQWTPELRQQSVAGMETLGEAMTIAQARLGAAPATRPLADHLLDLGFASERVVRAALHGLPAAQRRKRALEAIATIRAALVSGMRLRIPGKPLSLKDHVLTQLAFLARVVARRPPERALVPKDQATAVDMTSRYAALKQAAQAAVAVAVAIAVGHAISPERWYWAAFATFLVFQGVRSRQETVLKAIQIAMGTVGGVFVGVLLATLLSFYPLAASLVAIAALFLAFYASTAAYGVMIFWVTIIIGLVFGMRGYFPPELLALRLEETLLGAVCGVAAAFLLRIDQRRDSVDHAACAFLEALRDTVAAATPVIASGGDAGQAAAAATLMQERFIAYAGLALPRLRGLPGLWSQDARRRLIRLRACNHWARSLSELAARGTPEPDAETRTVLTEESHRIAAIVEARTSAATDLHGARQPSPPFRFAPRGASERSHEAFRLMLAIEGALARSPVTSDDPGAGKAAMSPAHAQ